MGAVDATGQADDAASCIHIPIGSTEAGEGRDQVDAVGIRDGLSEFIAAGCLVDHLEFIPQPLDGGAAVEGRTFEAVSDIVIGQGPGNAGDEVALRLDALVPGVHEQEAARTVGGLHDAFLERTLAEEGSGLVADGAGDRSAFEAIKAGDAGGDEAIDFTGGHDLRQDVHGDVH